MPSSYEQHGRSFGEPEKETPIGPYKTYEEAFDAGFFESAKKDGAQILMDPPENSRSNNPIKLKIVDFQPRHEALGLPNVVDISPSKPKDEKESDKIVPIGETEGGSRVPISGANGRNFRLAPQEISEK